MQTLGTQILFGFQLQSLFQPGFERAGKSERIAARHRLAGAGDASRELLRLSDRCAELALGTIAIALGCIAFSLATHLGVAGPAYIAGAVTVLTLIMWFGAGVLRKRPSSHTDLPERESLDLHAKIDQMLTEARVVLPGVQALMGFQLIVVMTEAFQRLPTPFRNLHLIGLALTALSIALLLMPAAVHRISFAGDDDSRFHTIGSALVGAASGG